MRARAHWPNVAQIDLTVVVVIVGVVVAVIVDMLRRYCCFSKSVTDTQIHTHTHRHRHTHTHRSGYRVAPQLKMEL